MKKFLIIRKNKFTEECFEMEGPSLQEVVEIARKETNVTNIRIYDITNSEKAIIR